jgi:ABC-2 type transport system permease protein
MKQVTRHFAKYFEIARINSVGTVQHTTNLIMRGVVVTLRLWIFAQLYKVTFKVSEATAINGLTVPLVVWTLTLVQTFQASSRPPVSRMIDEEVKTGTLSYALNRPYAYPLFHYFGFLGRALPNMAIMLSFGAIAALLLVGPVQFTWSGLFAGLLMVLLGISIDFAISLIIGLSAFWIEETSAFMWLFHKGFLVFGGAIIPLALFPENIRVIAEHLPFAQMYYAPARMIVGFEPGLFQHFLTLQVLWLSVMSSIAYIMYRKGVKHVTVNGG